MATVIITNINKFLFCPCSCSTALGNSALHFVGPVSSATNRLTRCTVRGSGLVDNNNCTIILFLLYF